MLTKQIITQKIIEIIKKLDPDVFLQTELPEACNENSDLSDLGFDSLDIVEFVMEVEKEFDILFIEDADISKFNKIKDVVDYACKLLNIKE